MAFLDFAFVFFTAVAFSVLAVPILLRFAHSKEIYDLPDHTENNGRRIHIKPIPRLGGIAIVGSFFFTLLIWKVPLYSPIIYSASLVFFFLGLVDDLKNLSAKLRLLVQFGISSLTVIYADLSLKSIVLTPSYIIHIPAYIGIFLGIFIIIGAINAMNMIDGLDGLASGVGLIGISILSYYLFLHSRKHDLLLLFTIPILGSVIGFLKYNTHPSIIFMGDSGSNWLGFMVGIFILIIANETPSIPLLNILLAFSIPIFDTAHVIILRLINGKNPMTADNRHFHHSLIKLGFSHSQSVGIIYFLMFFFGVLGMIPIAFKSYNLWWISWLGAALLVCLFVVSIKFKNNLMNSNLFSKIDSHEKDTIKKQLLIVVSLMETLQRYTIYFLLITISLIEILKKTHTLLGIFMGMICLTMLAILYKQKKCSFLLASCIVIITTILFSMSKTDAIVIEFFSVPFYLKTVYNFIFLFLFLNTIFFCFVSLKRKYFIITPTDILLILVPLLLLMMPDTWKNDYGLRLFMVRGLVLFAGLRIFRKQSFSFIVSLPIPSKQYTP